MTQETPFNFRWNFLGALSDIITQYWRDDYTTAVEWGAGYSTFILDTVLALKENSLLLSIEHYEPYYKKLCVDVSDKNTNALILSELFEFDRMSENSQLYYTTVPFKFGRQIDIALIDGRCRSECLLVAAQMLSPNGIVILDDSARARYIAAMSMFEVIDQKLRFTVMKLRPEFREAFKSHTIDWATYKQLDICIPEKPRHMGMGFVPSLPEFSSIDKTSMLRLIEKHDAPIKSILIWGSEHHAMAIAEQINLDAVDRIMIIGDENSTQDSNLFSKFSDKIALHKVSLTGSLNDWSKDPALHYSSAPLCDDQEWDLVVIAGQRRNECLMTALYKVHGKSLIISQFYDEPHYAVGHRMYDIRHTEHTWASLKANELHLDAFNTRKEAVNQSLNGREMLLVNKQTRN